MGSLFGSSSSGCGYFVHLLSQLSHIWILSICSVNVQKHKPMRVFSFKKLFLAMQFVDEKKSMGKGIGFRQYQYLHTFSTLVPLGENVLKTERVCSTRRKIFRSSMNWNDFLFAGLLITTDLHCFFYGSLEILHKNCGNLLSVSGWIEKL